MKDLVKRFLDNGLSRRQFTSGLGGLGVSGVAATTMAQSLAPYAKAAEPSSVPAEAVRQATGTGGALFVEQLKAAGIEYIFFNPATADYAIYDALVDEPSIQLIKGLQEGAVVAMADGYARASGKTGMVMVAEIGITNAMTQMINSWKDQIPIVVAVATIDQNDLGGEMWQASDHQNAMADPITKWLWQADTLGQIPATLRRALKFASTTPCGPVYISLPMNLLRDRGTATIWDHSKFDVPMRIRPEKANIEKAARALIESKNPLMTIGDEITWSGGAKEVVELADLLGLPVAGQAGAIGYWSKPFPTRHPLYLGPALPEMRYPGKPDVVLNVGYKYGERVMPGTTLISIRVDPTSLARQGPVDIPIVADIRMACIDLIEAIHSLATPSRLVAIAAERLSRTAAYTREMQAARERIARENANRSPVSLERLAMELESTLDRDTIYVADVDSGKTMDPLMTFGGDDKHYLATGPSILGWGIPAAMGVKLARPDQPVVSVVGDGSFHFSGPQPLWSQVRYEAPVLNIVLNNHSYNNERNRIASYGGRQVQSGRDMTCYNGNPDVNCAKAAEAYGCEAEVVSDPGAVKAALARGRRAVAEGRPYLLDVQTSRDGAGATSTWHPAYSIAGKRKRKV
jgi:thiamine pyrophosphate-dependent acetolactate synthase large subunit-like protein